MKKQNQDPLTDLMNFAAHALGALRRAEQHLGPLADRGRDLLVDKLDLPSRDEVDAALVMIEKLRENQAKIDARLKRIEAKMTLSRGVKPSAKKQISRKK